MLAIFEASRACRDSFVFTGAALIADWAGGAFLPLVASTRLEILAFFLGRWTVRDFLRGGPGPAAGAVFSLESASGGALGEGLKGSAQGGQCGGRQFGRARETGFYGRDAISGECSFSNGEGGWENG